jgi:hypothetical protein
MTTRLRHLAATSFLCLSSAGAWGADVPQHKVVDGIDVYYGIVPAQIVQAHVKEHGAVPMHKKNMLAKGLHHLVVTLYDARTAERITDANVSATVTPLGLNPETKALDVMNIDGTISYGNYFSMPRGETPYRIAVSIKRPSDHLPGKVEFEYRHASSR